MAVTYEPIATTTLGSAASSYTFSSISGAYTDLVLVASTQATTSGQGQIIQLNSDTGSNYSATIVRGYGSTADSARVSNVTGALLSNTAEPPTASFGTYIANFQNYSNSTTYKTILCRANNASIATDAIVNLWRSTSAITSIKISISGGNFATGSTFTLYGIKAA